MGGIREFQYDNVIEQSNAPAGNAPTGSEDMVSLGFANEEYAFKSSWGDKVADINALKAVAPANRFDGQTVKVTGLGTGGTFYQFDADSASVADNDLVVEPTTGTGRWIKGASGSGGSGGGGSGLEQVLQKADMEKSGIFTDPLDNSIHSSGVSKYINSVVARLLRDHVATDTILDFAYNPIFENDSDKDMQATTNWSATGAAASLASDTGDKRINTNSVVFDKNNTAAEAAIRYDRGSQNFGYGYNTEKLFWVKLPSLTNFSKIIFRVYKDSTSNFRTYDKTTDISGNAIAVGWNLIKVDLVNDSGTNSGTGWTTSDLSRYPAEIGVVTTTIGQTLTGIRVASLCASLTNPKSLGLLGQVQTIFNDATKEDIIIDSANTLYAGRVTLASALANNYAGGSVVTAASKVQRSTLSSSGDGYTFDSTLSSGDIVETQEVRFSRKLRETISGSLNMAVDVVSDQISKVLTVGGSTIDIDDPADLSANWVNGDVVDVLRPMDTDGETSYTYVGEKTMTANSSHSSGVTTLTFPVSGIAVDDIVVKRALSSKISAVATTANEAFTTASLMSSPNGIQILDNIINYPFRDKMIGHYSLGGALGANNVAPNPIIQLTPNGTLNQNERFLFGRKATSGWSGANYYTISSTYASYFHGAQRTVMSLWFYGTAFNATNRNIFNFFNSPNTGIIVALDSSSNVVSMFNESQTVTVPYVVGKWNHLLINILDGDTYLVVNGVKSGVSTNANANASLNAVIGTNATGSGVALNTTDLLADLAIWHNSPAFSSELIKSIYRGGNYVPFNVGKLRYRTQNNGVSGQKISSSHTFVRTTNGVSPGINKHGLILA